MFSSKEKKKENSKKFTPPPVDCKSSEHPMHVSTASRRKCRLLPGTRTQANKCSDKERERLVSDEAGVQGTFSTTLNKKSHAEPTVALRLRPRLESKAPVQG